MEGIRGTTHPLETPLILECIFSKLAITDLKNCRLVSKTWRRSGAVAIRNIFLVDFENTEKVFELLKLVKSDNSIFSDSPFAAHYVLFEIHFDDTEFFEVCGRSVKTLLLSSVQLGDKPVDNFRRIIFQLCPNMTELTLQSMILVEDDDPTEEPAVWAPPQYPQNKNLGNLEIQDDMELGDVTFLEILSHFPDLREIAIQSTDESSERIFQALATARKHDQERWNVKSLHFEFDDLPEPEENIQPLLEANLPLETLKVAVTNKAEEASALGKILCVYGTSLRSLNVSGNKVLDALDTPHRRVFEKLKDLGLDSVTLSSTAFLLNFPNLQKLELSSVSTAAEFSRETFNEWATSGCEELLLSSKHLKMRGLEKLLQRLPKLQKLTIDYCDNKMFSVICKLAPNLIYLCIERNNKMSCAGISGLDKEDARRINTEETLTGCTRWRPVTVARANISCLKKLKWFQFQSNPSARYTHYLRACSLVCGVQQLTQLEHLKFVGYILDVWDSLLSQCPWKDP